MPFSNVTKINEKGWICMIAGFLLGELTPDAGLHALTKLSVVSPHLRPALSKLSYTSLRTTLASSSSLHHRRTPLPQAKRCYQMPAPMREVQVRHARMLHLRFVGMQVVCTFATHHVLIYPKIAFWVAFEWRQFNILVTG